jgi:hypothetical protein
MADRQDLSWSFLACPAKLPKSEDLEQAKPGSRTFRQVKVAGAALHKGLRDKDIEYKVSHELNKAPFCYFNQNNSIPVTIAYSSTNSLY